MDEMTDINALWEHYKATNDRRTREELILNYAPLVKFVASRVGVGLPQSVDKADLVSYGIFGLIDAIDKFDPDRGFKFETYAMPRIKGSIIDELRSIDWVPRSVRSKAREIDRTYDKLESERGKTPSQRELAAELEISEEELNRHLGQVSQTGITTLDKAGDGESVSLLDVLVDHTGSLDSFEIDELSLVLADAIQQIASRYQIVLALYYYENLTLSKIGFLLGVTESRVCQIHTNALLELRSFLTLDL